jgi:hypothetical protein
LAGHFGEPFKATGTGYPAVKNFISSSGEFVGMIADNPDQKIELKTFCAEIINDYAGLKKEAESYKDLPQICDVSQKEILKNYQQIKKDVTDIIQIEMEE